MPTQAKSKKKLAELEATVVSHGSETATLKAAADAELKQAHVAADAKIQTYNQRTNEVTGGASVALSVKSYTLIS